MTSTENGGNFKRPTFVHPLRLDISKTLSEVHHYTDWNGLEGIWNSGTLFATRYTQLNDSSEIIHCRDLLLSALERRFRPFVVEWKKGHLSRQRRVNSFGGALQVAHDGAKATVDALYQTSFDASKMGPPFAVPYITSFCGLGNHRRYEQSNGLLSQWRGYGGTERFAIVFDTAALERLIDRESELFAYAFMEFSEVVYNGEVFDFEKSYQPLIEAAEEVCEIVQTTRPDSLDVPIDVMEKLVPMFLSATCSIKHQGFAEESEVRIVAAPIPEFRFSNMIRDGDDTHGRKLKAVERIATSTSESAEIVRLFDWNGGKRLPINRIIVGPQRDQRDLIARVIGLVGPDVRVRRSETPFIG